MTCGHPDSCHAVQQPVLVQPGSDEGVIRHFSTAFRGKRHSIAVGVPGYSVPADFNLSGQQIAQNSPMRGLSGVQAQPMLRSEQERTRYQGQNARRSSVIEGLMAQEHARNLRKTAVFRSGPGQRQLTANDFSADSGIEFPQEEVGIVPRPFVRAAGPFVATVDQILNAPLRRMSIEDLQIQPSVEPERHELMRSTSPVVIIRATLPEPPTSEDETAPGPGLGPGGQAGSIAIFEQPTAGEQVKEGQQMRSAIKKDSGIAGHKDLISMRGDFRAKLQAMQAMSAAAPRIAPPQAKPETCQQLASSTPRGGAAVGQNPNPQPPSVPKTRNRPGILQRKTSATKMDAQTAKPGVGTGMNARIEAAKKKMKSVKQLVRIVSEVEQALDKLSKPIECKCYAFWLLLKQFTQCASFTANLPDQTHRPSRSRSYAPRLQASLCGNWPQFGSSLIKSPRGPPSLNRSVKDLTCLDPGHSLAGHPSLHTANIYDKPGFTYQASRRGLKLLQRNLAVASEDCVALHKELARLLLAQHNLPNPHPDQRPWHAIQGAKPTACVPDGVPGARPRRRCSVALYVLSFTKNLPIASLPTVRIFLSPDQDRRHIPTAPPRTTRAEHQRQHVERVGRELGMHSRAIEGEQHVLALSLQLQQAAASLEQHLEDAVPRLHVRLPPRLAFRREVLQSQHSRPDHQQPVRVHHIRDLRRTVFSVETRARINFPV
eukprot:179699-Rhodomonas_salina.5